MTNKVIKFLNTRTGVVTVAAVCVIGAVIYARKKAPVAMGNAALNIYNPMLNGAANWVGQKVSGDENWTIAGAFYD